jgi:thioredoxin reductase
MNTNVDYLVIGAGPAGLQLGYFFEKNHRNYLILERSDSPGAFFKKFPRHRMLISINKVNTGKDNPETNLRWDWNSLLSDNQDLLLKNYSQRYFPDPDDLVRYLADYAHHYDLKVKYNTTAARISKKEGMFIVTDQNGDTFTTKRLILATGVTQPFMPDIPGIELADQYKDHSLNLAEYKDKRVMIIGKGNSAFETANYLSETAAVIHLCSPHSVKFAWDSHFVGNLRAVNTSFLDTYQLKSQNTVIDATIDWIQKEGDKYKVHISYTHAKGQTRVLSYDKVIACTGFRVDTSIFDADCRPELIHWDKFPAQTAEWESVNVSDLYFAGTLMQACDFKKTMSGFIHGFRYNVRALSQILELKYHGVPLPKKTIPATPESLLQHYLDRINHGSGIWLQPGFMCDVIVVDDQAGTADYYEDIRVDYVAHGLLSQNPHYYTITLAYGHHEGDPFRIERDPSPDKADQAFYLHPIIRRFNGHQLVSELHVQDDLESEWFLDEYVQPAQAYFTAQLGQITPDHAYAD